MTLSVALMQPAFLPWQGFFALAASVDVLVFLDDFQYSRQSWQQRNRLFTGRDTVGWITVPVERHAGRDGFPGLHEARPRLDALRGKFLATLRQSYARAPHLDEWLPVVEAWLMAEHASLAELNMAFARQVMTRLGIAPRIELSSRLGHEGRRSAAVDALLRRVGATRYHAARGSFGYMRQDGLFPRAGLQVVFQDFVPAPHAQLHAQEFVPYLSVLDALLNVGARGTAALLQAGARPFTNWDELAAADEARPEPLPEADEA